MTNETIPELPDWVKVLIADARQEGWSSGFREGGQKVLHDLQQIIDTKVNYW